MRIFLDTNVLASSLATRGLCNELLEGVIDEHVLLTCGPVLEELQRILTDKFRLPLPVIAGFLGMLETEARIVQAGKALKLKFSDPDDIPILACAISGQADFFVTGDKALLALGRVEDMPIVSPRQLWQTLAGLDG